PSLPDGEGPPHQHRGRQRRRRPRRRPRSVHRRLSPPSAGAGERAAERAGMTPAERATAILADSGAVIRDSHIVYTSGRHGSAYVHKDAVYPHTERVRELCELMADAARSLGAELVCGPAMG